MSVVSNHDIGFATEYGLIFGTLVFQTSGDYSFKEKTQVRYEFSFISYFVEFETNRFVVGIEN